jgi:hypothetical protein
MDWVRRLLSKHRLGRFDGTNLTWFAAANNCVAYCNSVVNPDDRARRLRQQAGLTMSSRTAEMLRTLARIYEAQATQRNH